MHARRYFTKALDAGDARAALPLAAFKSIYEWGASVRDTSPPIDWPSVKNIVTASTTNWPPGAGRINQANHRPRLWEKRSPICSTTSIPSRTSPTSCPVSPAECASSTCLRCCQRAGRPPAHVGRCPGVANLVTANARRLPCSRHARKRAEGKRSDGPARSSQSSTPPEATILPAIQVPIHAPQRGA